MQSEKYIKYFNHGYFLAQYEAKVLEKLKRVVKDSPDILLPLKAGEREYRQERVQEQIKNIKAQEGDRGERFEW